MYQEFREMVSPVSHDGVLVPAGRFLEFCGSLKFTGGQIFGERFTKLISVTHTKRLGF